MISINDISTKEKHSFVGGPFGSNLKVSDYTSCGVRVIQLNNINDIYFNDENRVFVSDSKANSLKSCNAFPGDLIFAKMMPAGRLCILPNTYSRYLLGSDAIRLNLNISKFDPFFILENINRPAIRNSITSRTAGSTRQRIGLPELKRTKFYCPDLQEQTKIGDFFRKIEGKIDVTTKKIDILKKYKKGLENKAFTFVDLSKERLKFSELFEIKNIRNKEYLKQYAVGKYGIKEMSEEKYDISNHKIFSNEDLIIGIGIEEIGISDNITGCVSPVYDVFSIAKPEYFQSLKWTLKNQLWRKRRFISKKSTRREFEVDKNELMKFNIAIISNSNFYYYYHAFDNINRAINCLELLKSKLLKIKSFFLSNMFV